MVHRGRSGGQDHRARRTPRRSRPPLLCWAIDFLVYVEESTVLESALAGSLVRSFLRGSGVASSSARAAGSLMTTGSSVCAEIILPVGTVSRTGPAHQIGRAVCHERHPDDRAGQRVPSSSAYASCTHRSLWAAVSKTGRQSVDCRSPNAPAAPAGRRSARRLDARQRGTFAVLVEDPPAPQHQGDLARQDHGALIDGTQQSQCQQHGRSRRRPARSPRVALPTVPWGGPCRPAVRGPGGRRRLSGRAPG